MRCCEFHSYVLRAGCLGGDVEEFPTILDPGAQHTLLEQLAAFPFGQHDDGPDALEMAVQAARRVVCCDRPPEIIFVPSPNP